MIVEAGRLRLISVRPNRRRIGYFVQRRRHEEGTQQPSGRQLPFSNRPPHVVAYVITDMRLSGMVMCRKAPFRGPPFATCLNFGTERETAARALS